MKAWYDMARKCEEDYGSQVDYEEGFFVCSECGESIYECDWSESELRNEDGEYICPVCGEVL